MIKVYQADSLVEGQLLSDQLREAGIPVELFHQNGSGALGELPVVYPEVWIRRDWDFEKAKPLIKSFSIRKMPDQSVKCKQCGEQNPENFEICWHCQDVLPIDL